MSHLLLVTSWGVPCGISEHSQMLVEAVRAHDKDFQIIIAHDERKPPPPDAVLAKLRDQQIPILHLNYHAALHSQYTPDSVKQFQALGTKVVITFHDTGIPNSDQCKALEVVADAFVVHEACEDLPRAHYIRMGVADWPVAYDFDTKRRPMLGSIGFPFPWKNYDKLAEVTARCGWDLFLIAPNATAEDEARWKALNPRTTVSSTFIPRDLAVSWLAGCDATAFLYVCHNTGQSGAILQGIAARKPVIALKTCRQFRSLYEDPLGRATIKWAETFDDVAAHLRNVRIQRIDPGIVALAEQESWSKVGAKYLDIYRSLL